MKLSLTAENRLACTCAAVGAFFAITALRWGMDGGFLASLTGKEGFRTLVLAVAAGAITWVAVSKKLWGHFPWDEDPHRQAIRGGEVISKETGDASEPQARTTVNIGPSCDDLQSIQHQLAKLSEGIAKLEVKLDESHKSKPLASAKADEDVSKALVAITSQMDAALRNAREEVERRDKTNESLADTLKRATVQRTLARITSTLELAKAVAAKVSEGKTTPSDALDFLLGDLESALQDNNVNFESIAIGTRLNELIPGSFTPVAYLDAPSPELAGTVKEVKTAAYYIQDEEGKRRYIAPAKLILFKV